MKKLLLFLGLLVSCLSLFGQEIEVGGDEMEVITIKEWNIFAAVNSSGFSVGFQQGRTPTPKDKYLWEIEFSYCFHHKAVKGRVDTRGRAFSYGKLYDLFFLRGGYGYQRVITYKPYYGGVQIRYFVHLGATVCFGLPAYLEIWKRVDDYFYTEVERYDPEKPEHHLGNIFGGARFFDRFNKVAVRPGFYGKTGLNFDFSRSPLSMQMLEVGVSMDMVFPFIQQMAFNKTKPAYFYAYISYSFGKRKPKYDL